jgi:hypothetical protein
MLVAGGGVNPAGFRAGGLRGRVAVLEQKSV